MMSLVRPKLFLFGSLLFLLLLPAWFLLIPPSTEVSPRLILIKKGTPLKKVSQRLRAEGVIKSETLFVALATLLGKKGGIKAGEYEFHTRMLPQEVLQILVEGQVKRHLVTIPEGYTLLQIAQLLEDQKIVEKHAFFERTSSLRFISSLGLPAGVGPTLEGYLFPDTYHLICEMDPEEVIRMMVGQFQKVFRPELADRAVSLGLSETEAVTLASMIEKETSLSEEKPLISAVFHNRIKKKMPLQSDPTVIYGIKDFRGNLKKRHLLENHPFNTYLIPRLPPAPICNPGESSLWAALHPAPVPYLFFVSKNDGSHQFSSTLQEHQRAVSKYQAKK